MFKSSQLSLPPTTILNSMMKFEPPHEEQKPKKKLGMILGVIIPVLSNTFSAMLFLRLPFIAGQAGLGYTTLMFTIGYLVIWLTVFSMSAIVTNEKIGSGGAYHFVSRIMGPSFGGVIGVALFFANVTHGTMYVIGTVETLVSVFPGVIPEGWSYYWLSLGYGTVVNIGFMLVVVIGTTCFSYTEVVCFITLIVCVAHMAISFMFRMPGSVAGYTGWSWNTFVSNLTPNWAPDPLEPGVMHNFQTIFGIAFPCMVDMMAGRGLKFGL
jgi:amino acid permease